jgi:hypothetical protein
LPVDLDVLSSCTQPAGKSASFSVEALAVAVSADLCASVGPVEVVVVPDEVLRPVVVLLAELPPHALAPNAIPIKPTDARTAVTLVRTCAAMLRSLPRRQRRLGSHTFASPGACSPHDDDGDDCADGSDAVDP